MKWRSKTGIELALFLSLYLFFSACSSSESDNDNSAKARNTKKDTLLVTLINTSAVDMADAVIEISDPDLLDNLQNFSGTVRVSTDLADLPYQPVDADNNGKWDKLLILCDLAADQTTELIICRDSGQLPEFDKRTQAELSVKDGGEWNKIMNKDDGTIKYEYSGGSFKNISHLRVPDEHSDHSYYIRYEGPGWESDKVGYRFYLDWRNAVDIYGKKTAEMVLQEVGQDGFESYHEPAGWGMDILKVGGSLGIGSIAYWDGTRALRIATTDSVECMIIQNGNIRSAVETNYYGWKDANEVTNLKAVFSIDAGSRLTHAEITVSADLDNICTGIVKHDLAEFIVNEPEGKTWGCMATFGKQSLNDDMLGMAVFYRQNDLIRQSQDDESYVVVLSPEENSIEYYFGATWEPDADGIDDSVAFRRYLTETLNRLNNPVAIIF